MEMEVYKELFTTQSTTSLETLSMALYRHTHCAIVHKWPPQLTESAKFYALSCPTGSDKKYLPEK
jgi:hypothetical protein